MIYTRDRDPLFYLEGGERQRASENVQGLLEGEGGEGRGVGTLLYILVTRTLIVVYTWRVVRGGELLRMSRACLREREEGWAPCDTYS